MKILVLDSSSSAATVAIMEDERLLVETVINHQRTHSEKLLPMVEAALKDCGLKPKEIDVFAVTLGPGSFTGLRIGIAAIKAMAQALGKATVGISTLDALAWNLPYVHEMICPIIDAQRDRVYTASYRWGQQGMVRLSEYEILEVAELIKQIKETGDRTIFVGDGIERFQGQLEAGLGALAVFPPKAWQFPRGTALGELARAAVERGDLVPAQDLLPIYMRLSQAEKQFEERMAKEGRA